MTPGGMFWTGKAFDALGMGASALSNLRNRKFNAQQSQLAREQQSRQYEQNRIDAQHQYRYAVEDMKGAGLNPMMMYAGKGGATPTVGGGNIASASNSAQTHKFSSTDQQAVANIRQREVADSQIRNINANTDNTKLKTLQSAIKTPNLKMSEKVKLAHSVIDLANVEPDAVVNRLSSTTAKDGARFTEQIIRKQKAKASKNKTKWNWWGSSIEAPKQ